MSERKVLNKYYPPDFDPSKIPRMKLAKNRQYTVRLMAPFNMKCKTCGEYIYKGRKFNARKEDVEGDTYLGIRIYRFYIKCTGCCQEIIFKTDPQNTDYEIEVGATRNFMALLLAEKQAKQEQEDEKEEEASNPMKLLENRTQQSKREMDIIESLEELKDLNKRQQTVNYDQMLQKYDTTEQRIRTEKEQEEYDEQLVKEIFKNKRKRTGKIVEEETIELEEEELFEKNQIQEHLASSSSSVSSKPKISLEEKRKKLGIVVKKAKKSSEGKTEVKVEAKVSSTEPKDSEVTEKPSEVKKEEKEEKVEVSSSAKDSEVTEKPAEEKVELADLKNDLADSLGAGFAALKENSAPSRPSGLSLLSSYSGSDSDNDD